MALYLVIIILAFLAPLLMFQDKQARIKAESEPDGNYDPNGQVSSVIVGFAPFTLLFYTESFWLHTLYFIPLYLYFWVALVLISKERWFSGEATSVFFHGLGGFVLTVLGYYLFFHDGVLVEPEHVVTDTAEAVMTVTDLQGTLVQSGDAEWPFLIFASLVLGTLVVRGSEFLLKREPGLSSMLALASAIVLPILPLFTSNYWGGIISGFIALLVLLLSLFSGEKASSRAGVGFIYFYIYMMSFILSLIIYAFLF